MTLKTSGTTGKPKEYRWGPGFAATDRFFHELVFKGSAFGRVAKLAVLWLTDDGKPNSIGGSPHAPDPVVKIVEVGINKQGLFPPLREALAGYDILACPSAFDALDQTINLLDHLTPGAILAFTGEQLPSILRERLKGSGWQVRDQMRSWDGGATFFTCPHGSVHWSEILSDVRVQDGKLISTDYFNFCQPHVDYWNGDILSSHTPLVCPCGRPNAVALTFADRDELPFIHSHNGVLCRYEVLFAIASRTAQRAGTGPLLAAAFGVDNRDGLRLVVDYLIGQPRNCDQFEALVEAEYGPILRPKEVVFNRAVIWGERKLRRFYLISNN